MVERKHFGKASHVRLSRTVLSDDVDRGWAGYHKETSGTVPLLLDFKNAEYIDIAALVNCIAILLLRRERGLETYLGYPESKAVRDFLQVWRFRDAVEQAVRASIHELLLPTEHRYLQERQESYTGVGDGIDALEYDPDWESSGPARKNFFEFSTLLAEDRREIIPEGPLAEAPQIEAKRWTSSLIREVLRKHLGAETPKDDVARVIVYEVMSNAVRHPNARIIQVVSKFERRRTDRASKKTSESSPGTSRSTDTGGSLRMCIWDDGEPIAGTLMSTLKRGKSVRTFVLPMYMYERIIVRLRASDEKSKGQRVVDQSEKLTKESPEARLLLSSLFPGVSRAAEEGVTDVQAYDMPTSDKSTSVLSWAPGMGLYSLTRTALDQFQGTLLMRSGNYRLTMAIAHDADRVRYKARYKCTITKYHRRLPMFRGNLLVVQLPTRG